MPAVVCSASAALAAERASQNVPDCHRSEKDAPAPVHNRCCGDVTTSCCLKALDVDGAVVATAAGEPPTAAILLPVPSLQISLRSVHSAALPRSAVDPPPIDPGFRVLRL